jgi:hypothetical protein
MQIAVAKTTLIYKTQPKGAGHETDDAFDFGAASFRMKRTRRAMKSLASE